MQELRKSSFMQTNMHTGKSIVIVVFVPFSLNLLHKVVKRYIVVTEDNKNNGLWYSLSKTEEKHVKPNQPSSKQNQAEGKC